LRDETKPMVEVAPDVPPQVDALIHRCMRKNPDERCQTMHEVRDALAALKRESDSGVLYSSMIMPPSIQPAAKTPVSGSRTGLLIGVVAAVLVLIVGAGLWLRSSRKSAEPVPVAPAQVETPAKPAEETLNNDGIVALIQEKVPVEVILEHIHSAKTTS